MKKYIFDGNNIIHKHPEWRKLHARAPVEAAQAFIFALEKFALKYPSYSLSAVFDGNEMPSRSSARNISIRIPSGKGDADGVIRELIREIISPAGCTVVSSDTEVYNFARIHGCTAQTAEAFISELKGLTDRQMQGGTSPRAQEGKRSDKPRGVSKEEIKRMKRLFGLE